MNIITRNKTDLPIGKSGFYFTEKKIDEDSIIKRINHIIDSLYEVHTLGVRVTSIDDISSSSETFFDMYTLDLDDKVLYRGYVKKVNKFLYSIWDTGCGSTGSSSHDTVIIKNITTGKKTKINFLVSADEEIKKEKGLYVFSGSVYDSVENNNHTDRRYELTKKWKVFLDKNGNVVYKGYCWNYFFGKDYLIVKKFEKSKKEYKIVV